MKLGYIFLSLIFSISLYANDLKVQYKFRVYLKDKGNTEYSILEPEKFLTQQAIERKKRQQVKIDQSDFPISAEYFAELEKAGGKPISYSKWFKTVVVQLEDSSHIDAIEKLSFVDSVQYVWRGIERKQHQSVRPRLQLFERPDSSVQRNYLGITEKQFSFHNAKEMISSGFGGKGINIAIIDGGFTNIDVIPQFYKVKVKEIKSFVPGGDIFTSSGHGTRVFSTMAVNLPHIMMGSAPFANYYLLRSEDADTEFPVEEDYWVRAVEYADSIGADLINSSLGYVSFDDRNFNYRFKDLDGKTSFMSIATDKAFEKGLLMVSSAGNAGNSRWGKILVPADAYNTLAVGAASTDSVIASFSSKGFSFDKRVKPDVISVGRGTMTVGYNGLIIPVNGTSFSSPFMGGLVASLWSINPEMNRKDLVDIVKRSADRYNQPDSVYGYGIPDFGRAMKEVLGTLEVSKDTVSENSFSISRADKTHFLINLVAPKYSLKSYKINLLNEFGVLISEHQFEKDSLIVAIPEEVKKKNQFIHLVLKSVDTQKTVRFKL